MKKTIFFSILLFGFLSFGFANAVENCDRVPTDPVIYNYNVFSISCTGLIYEAQCDGEDCLYSQQVFGALCTPPVVASSTFNFSDDLGSYVFPENNIFIMGSLTDEVDGLGCFVSASSSALYLDFEDTFSVEGPEAEGNIITIPGGFIASVLAYAGRFFTDLETLVILLIGLPVGFWVIKKAIALVKKRIK
jgi:hypothetical protein